ncbi:hypothetical protein WDJ51_12640 [Rathayibacter sp. YIM 133350]|uniref:hypothetical protein n=1 Tax=Rathayibacter sp. YIM 133350 TaxID=3131992 RepID=UPI00307F3A03
MTPGGGSARLRILGGACALLGIAVLILGALMAFDGTPFMVTLISGLLLWVLGCVIWFGSEFPMREQRDPDDDEPRASRVRGRG